MLICRTLCLFLELQHPCFISEVGNPFSVLGLQPSFTGSLPGETHQLWAGQMHVDVTLTFVQEIVAMQKIISYCTYGSLHPPSTQPRGVHSGQAKALEEVLWSGENPRHKVREAFGLWDWGFSTLFYLHGRGTTCAYTHSLTHSLIEMDSHASLKCFCKCQFERILWCILCSIQALKPSSAKWKVSILSCFKRWRPQFAQRSRVLVMMWWPSSWKMPWKWTAVSTWSRHTSNLTWSGKQKTLDNFTFDTTI